MTESTQLFLGLIILCMAAYIVGVAEGMGLSSRVGIQIIKIVRGDPDAPTYEQIEESLKKNRYWVYAVVLSAAVGSAVVWARQYEDLPPHLFRILMAVAGGIFLCGVNSYFHKRDHKKMLAAARRSTSTPPVSKQ